MKPNSIFPTRRENYTISTAKTGFRLRSGLPWCPPIDDEPDYLFGLIVNETLEGAYNQYKSPRLMWGAILSGTASAPPQSVRSCRKKFSTIRHR